MNLRIGRILAFMLGVLLIALGSGAVVASNDAGLIDPTSPFIAPSERIFAFIWKPLLYVFPIERHLNGFTALILLVVDAFLIGILLSVIEYVIAVITKRFATTASQKIEKAVRGRP